MKAVAVDIAFVASLTLLAREAAANGYVPIALSLVLVAAAFVSFAVEGRRYG